MSKTGLFLLLLSAGIAIISVLAEYEPDIERVGAAHYKVTFRVDFFFFPSSFFLGPLFVPPLDNFFGVPCAAAAALLSTVQKLCI